MQTKIHSIFRKILPQFVVDAYHVWSVARYKSGGQSFIYTKNNVFPMNDYLRMKYDILYSELKGIVKGKTVLDIGCSSGYFTFLPAVIGAKKAVGIEVNKEIYDNTIKIAEFIEISNFDFINCNYPDLKIGRYDVVIALAVSHWAYQGWPGHLQWKEIIDVFSETTKEHLIIEYVDKNDETFKTHCPRNEFDGYELELFIEALDSNFTSVKKLGQMKKTRTIFLASK